MEVGLDIRAGDGGVFNNLAGGKFDARNDEPFVANLGGAAPVFNNAGIFQKTVGTGVTTIHLSFTNTGSVAVDTGTLSYISGDSSTGEFDFADGAVLRFPTSNSVLGGGVSIAGAGITLINGGTLTGGGDLSS